MSKYCSNCRRIVIGFEKKGYNEYRELVKAGKFTFLAGSCPLDDIEYHIERENLYTIEHYFGCKCGLIYYTGFCVRGKPIVKIVKEIPSNINITMSGYYGTYFDNKLD